MSDAPRTDERRPRERVNDLLTAGTYRTGAWLARGLPSFVADGLAAPIGLGAHAASTPQRRAMIERHLRRVRPDWPPWRLRRAVQEAFDSYTRYWIEALRLPGLSSRTIDRGFDVLGYHHVATALDAGRGVILALPHLGGWEWAGRWLTQRGLRVTVVVERIDPPEVFEWFVRLRRRLGMNVVPLGEKVSGELVRALADNHVVCLLCDRDITSGGVPVEFFGETTTLPAGPAMLSLRTGAPLLPVAVYFTQRVNGHQGVVRPPVPTDRRAPLREDVARVTQFLARELEHLIRRAPEQWHLFQPNWPSDPGYGAARARP